MSDRLYRLLVGLVLLTCLYLDLSAGIAALVIVQYIEGITNLRLPLLVSRVPEFAGSGTNFRDLSMGQFNQRLSFEAERAWRLLVPTLIILSYFVFGDVLWWATWFMGFAILGAGISGICPMMLFFRFLGFK